MSESLGLTTFTSFDGTPIAYLDRGEGGCVLLLHGFAADLDLNWVRCGVVDALVAGGHRVVATDARGHGASGKPHDPQAYANDAMVRDAVAMIDHLGVSEIDVVGYSMGSMVAARLTPVEPRVRRLVLGGVGAGMTERRPGWGAVADDLEADDVSKIVSPAGKALRRFADSTGADRRALAALQRSGQGQRAVDVTIIKVPTLVVTGDADVLVGSPHELAAMIPGGRVAVVSGDHLGAVTDPAFARAIVDFVSAP
jgi:pimeloyl-ACP methyl ester carboxylesterase